MSELGGKPAFGLNIMKMEKPKDGESTYSGLIVDSSRESKKLLKLPPEESKSLGLQTDSSMRDFSMRTVEKSEESMPSIYI